MGGDAGGGCYNMNHQGAHFRIWEGMREGMGGGDAIT